MLGLFGLFGLFVPAAGRKWGFQKVPFGRAFVKKGTMQSPVSGSATATFWRDLALSSLPDPLIAEPNRGRVSG